MVLQVDAFAGGVGGQQHPHRLCCRVGGEPCPDEFTLVGGCAALDDGQPVDVAVLGEHPHQPVDGVGVFGEHHHPLT